MNNTSSTSSSTKPPAGSDSLDSPKAVFELRLNSSDKDDGIFAGVFLGEEIIGLIPENDKAIRAAEVLASSMKSIELLHKVVDTLNEENEKGFDFSDPVVALTLEISTHLNEIFDRTRQLATALKESEEDSIINFSEGLSN